MRKLGDRYLAYTKPFDEELARKRFKERFGYNPEKILYENNKYMLVGPIKEE